MAMAAEFSLCACSFCRQCIEAELVGSAGGNICPACAREGERTLLGANPFAYHRLQPDFVLEALVRKIFPQTIRVEYEKRRPQVLVHPAACADIIAFVIKENVWGQIK